MTRDEMKTILRENGFKPIPFVPIKRGRVPGFQRHSFEFKAAALKRKQELLRSFAKGREGQNEISRSA